MKLVPFFLTKQIKGEFTVWKLSLFLSHAGKSIWDEAGSFTKTIIQREFCESNDLFPKAIVVDTSKQIAYIQIDTEKTKISDFYTWEEALSKPEKPECWRNFYFMQDKESIFWWSPKEIIEAEIQGAGNVQDIFEEIIRWSKDKKQNIFI